MKKTTLAENTTTTDFYAFFEEEFSGAHPQPLAVLQHEALERNSAAAVENLSFLDDFMTAMKLTFLYLPGALTVHFLALGFGLAFFYEVSTLEILPGFLGIFAVATFMMMFGIGKLRDLKYLKVVGGVFLTSMMWAALLGFLFFFTKDKFFGWFLLATWLPSAVTGLWIKNKLDGETQF